MAGVFSIRKPRFFFTDMTSFLPSDWRVVHVVYIQLVLQCQNNICKLISHQVKLYSSKDDYIHNIVIYIYCKVSGSTWFLHPNRRSIVICNATEVSTKVNL